MLAFISLLSLSAIDLNINTQSSTYQIDDRVILFANNSNITPLTFDHTKFRSGATLTHTPEGYRIDFSIAFTDCYQFTPAHQRKLLEKMFLNHELSHSYMDGTTNNTKSVYFDYGAQEEGVAVVSSILNTAHYLAKHEKIKPLRAILKADNLEKNCRNTNDHVLKNVENNPTILGSYITSEYNSLNQSEFFSSNLIQKSIHSNKVSKTNKQISIRYYPYRNLLYVITNIISKNNQYLSEKCSKIGRCTLWVKDIYDKYVLDMNRCRWCHPLEIKNYSDSESVLRFTLSLLDKYNVSVYNNRFIFYNSTNYSKLILTDNYQ